MKYFAVAMEGKSIKVGLDEYFSANGVETWQGFITTPSKIELRLQNVSNK